MNENEKKRTTANRPIGVLKKNKSLSALQLPESQMNRIEEVVSSIGISLDTTQFRNSEINTESPEKIFDHLNDFNVILKEPILCSGFRKFLTLSFSAENLLFYKEIENYRCLFDPFELRLKALEINNDFINSSSANEVNLSHSFKEKFQFELENENFFPPANYFDLVQLEIYNLMKRNFFINYLHDQIFVETKNILERVRFFSMETKSENENENELTERDWKLILTEAKEVSFDKNSILIQQNQKNSFLYQLKSGKLLVQKTIGSEEVTISSIEKVGTIFGEMSVLGKLGIATASILSSSPVVVSRLEVPFIYALFLSDPMLAKRFYVNMALKLAKLLQDISSITPSSSSSSSKWQSCRPSMRSQPPRYTLLSSSPPSRSAMMSNQNNNNNNVNYNQQNNESNGIVSEADTACQLLFGLPDTELVVKEIQCDLEKIVTRRGRLFISQHFLCFFSRIFGQKIKEIINIKTITDVEDRIANHNHFLIITTSSKSKFRFNFKSEEELKTIQMIINDFKTAVDASESPLVIPTLSSTSLNETSISQIDNLSLTPEDWETLLGSTKPILTFSKGDPIMIEGQHYSMICQIVSGTCRIEKQLPDQPISIVLGKMFPGEIFGEITFLTEGTATASVYADEDVDMYFIDGKYLKETLMKTHPHVVVRFYNYLCVNLAKRIAQREKEGWRRK